jgi:hypothetical protein
MRQWAKELILYSSKIYQLKRMIKRVKDERKRPQIGSATIFTVMLFGFLFRIRSMEELDRSIQKGRFRQLIPQSEVLPSHDTVRRALSQWDLESLQQNHDQFIAKFKQNKGPAKGSIEGWRVAAIDGVELFTSSSHTCPECLTRIRSGTGHTEYFHRAALMQKVGGDPRIIYGMELLKRQDGSDKAEGETIAARRLIREVASRHGMVADILTLDALYAKAPIIHEALDNKMHVVIRMKEERRSIMKDAKGLFDARPPDSEWIERDSKGNRVKVQAWDEPNLESWPQVRVPLRMIKMIRTTEKNVVVAGEKKVQWDTTERWIVTTCTKEAVPTATVGRIAAARWDIENMGFHDLKTYWHMDHAFIHNPVAIEALLGILILAVNLLYVFLFQHLHHFRDWKIPITEVVEEIKEQIRWQPFRMLHLLWDTT